MAMRTDHALEFAHHLVLRVDLEVRSHAAHHRVILPRRRRLRLHEALHLRRHAPLRLDQRRRRRGQPRRDGNLVDAAAEHCLEVLGRGFEGLLRRLIRRLLLLRHLAELGILLGGVHHLKVLELAHCTTHKRERQPPRTRASSPPRAKLACRRRGIVRPAAAAAAAAADLAGGSARGLRACAPPCSAISSIWSSAKSTS
jgi:hypothetical protein